LTAFGKKEAQASGRRLAARGIRFDVAYTSRLSRAQSSCSLMLAEMGQGGTEICRSEALNERDYGDLTGLDKNEVRRRWSDDQVQTWRRSYLTAPRNGESLRDTVARLLPYYVSTILREVMRGRTDANTAVGVKTV